MLFIRWRLRVLLKRFNKFAISNVFMFCGKMLRELSRSSCETDASNVRARMRRICVHLGYGKSPTLAPFDRLLHTFRHSAYGNKPNNLGVTVE